VLRQLKDVRQHLPLVHPTSTVVRRCYDVLSLCPRLGIEDFTDGRYLDNRNDRSAYLEAQKNQAEYLLDEIECRAGCRILDVGCGYGRILQAAEQRKAQAVGITISPQQVKHNCAQGLNVYLCNYRNLMNRDDWPEWEGAFDGIVANGSLEHFVQPTDVIAGRCDALYHEMFEIFRHLLKPGGRLATTAIHCRFEGQVDAKDLLQGPEQFPSNSVTYHAANLHRSFGGWFPYPGQLEHSAEGNFRLINEEDGTDDYLHTSEYWMRQIKCSIAFKPRAWLAAGQTFAAHPVDTYRMLKCLLWDQSWTYQFRPPAPAILLRQTWEAV